MELGGIVVNKTAHLVTVDGERIDLSFKEFELSQLFLWRTPEFALYQRKNFKSCLEL